MLTNNSIAKISIVNKPFKDVDIIVDYLLYIVHLEQTLKRNFTGKKYAKVLHY